jgi:hypothetical protein
MWPFCQRIWTTRKVCTEAANVFAVRVRDSRFGQTDRLPGLVDPAIVGPTVPSSERAELDLESIDVYARPPFYKGPDLQWVNFGPIHDLRPPAIVDVHGAT